MSDTPAPWWSATDPHVAALAKRIAKRHGANVEQLCMPYPPALIETPSGTAALLDVASALPLWVFYLPMAEAAIQTVEEMALDRVVAPMPDDGGAFVDTDTAWRQENGLDAAEED